MTRFCLAILTFLLLTAPVGAQPRVPDTEMWAFGGDVGAFVPAEDALDNTVDLQGFAEYYLSPRTGIRMGLGWTDPSFGESNRSLQAVRLTFDVTYNWEGGATHPFVGFGAGVYFLQPEVGGSDRGDSTTEAGANFFGGFEYFTSRTVALKVEGRYQIVDADRTADMHGLTISLGLKKYF